MLVIFGKPCKSIAPVTQNNFRHFFRHVRMSRSATCSPECCARHEKCDSSSENDAKVLRLSLCETCWDVTKCHVRHTKRGYATFETSKSDNFCSTHQRHGHSAIIANSCGRLRSWKQRRAQPPDPQSKTRTLRYALRENVHHRQKWEAPRMTMQQMKKQASEAIHFIIHVSKRSQYLHALHSGTQHLHECVTWRDMCKSAKAQQGKELSNQVLVGKGAGPHSWHLLDLRRHVGLHPWPCTSESARGSVLLLASLTHWLMLHMSQWPPVCAWGVTWCGRSPRNNSTLKHP